MRGKIALIARAIYGARNAFAPLLGVVEASSYYRKGMVKVVFSDTNPEYLAREYKDRGYKPVILYGLSSFVYLEIREELKSIASKYTVVAGGPHVEGAYWQVLRDGVELAVVGDGENAMDSILEYYIEGGDPASIPNIAYREEDGSFRVSKIVNIDLDDYPAYTSLYELFPPIEIMRGCHYRCRFCQVPWLFKKRVRYRSIERVLEAVKYYVKSGKRRIRFIAPIGFAYMSRELGKINYTAIERLLRGVRGLGGIPFLGSFPSETRPEYVDEEILSIIRKYAGNRKISIGLQSGSNRLLERAWRDHTVEDAIEAIRLILKTGLKPVVDIIFGLPGETDEDVIETVQVMRLLAAWRARMRLHVFMPLPGTPYALEKPIDVHPLYKETVRKLLGLGVIEGDWMDQEGYAWRIHCLMASDPRPTRDPEPLLEELEECRKRRAYISH